MCKAFLDGGLVRVFADDLRRPEMKAALEGGQKSNSAFTYLSCLMNVARSPDFKSRFVTLARDAKLAGTVKDYVHIKCAALTAFTSSRHFLLCITVQYI